MSNQDAWLVTAKFLLDCAQKGSGRDSDILDIAIAFHDVYSGRKDALKETAKMLDRVSEIPG